MEHTLLREAGSLTDMRMVFFAVSRWAKSLLMLMQHELSLALRSTSLPRKLYKHEPLPSGRWFRLIQLFPGQRDDIIKCRLNTCELDKAPPYDPISYCWGDVNDRQEIVCNGRRLSITASLHSALVRFRDTKTPRMLWADGICIDQSNDVEKGHQVGFMAEIYRHGHHTLVWLGLEQQSDVVDTQLAIDLMKEYNAYYVAEYEKRPIPDRPFRALAHCPPPPSNHRMNSEAEQKKIKDFLQRQWFDRTWVLQEVAVSKKVTVYYGDQYGVDFAVIALFALIYASRGPHLLDSSVPTGRILNAFSSLYSALAPPNSWAQGTDLLQAMMSFDIQLNAKFSKEQNALALMNTGRSFLASDNRDHIFAFLGHPVIASIMEPDYTLSLDELNLRLAERLTSLSNTLEQLVYTENQAEDLASAHPSWVSQWHKFPRERFQKPPNKHNCWGSASDVGHSNISVQAGRLHSAGFVLDQITAVSHQINDGDFKRKSDPTALDTVEELWPLFADSMKNRSQNPETVWVQFIWTLILGATPSAQLLPADVAVYCRERCGSRLYQLSIKSLGPDPSDVGRVEQFATDLNGKCRRRRLFATERGICGNGNSVCWEGDVVAMIYGCRMPLVLRPTGQESYYKLVGWCYVHELGLGENFEEILSITGAQEQEIILI
ncbi:heterokaryon incompatibility protein-domain-containing protein [Nemania serpens]|nr:heterokaryon incompatibility protein-domain-containing protein [Nemania serpens]